MPVGVEQDAALVRTGVTAATAYGWDQLARSSAIWSLDVYLPVEVFSKPQEQPNRLDIDDPLDEVIERRAVLLRVVDEQWPFPSQYPIAPQPVATLDLLDCPDLVARRIGREVLSSLVDPKPPVLAHRSARARMVTGSLLRETARAEPRARARTRPRVEGDPRTDTRGWGRPENH